MKMLSRLLPLVLASAGLFTSTAATKKIVILAGKQSHGPGDHEFRAGSLLLKKCLDGVSGVQTEVHTNGWPQNASAFEGADAVLIYADGGGGHPAIQGERMKIIDDLVKKGVGIGCAHYGVEVPKGEPGAALHRWIGGYYEHQFSVNPMWKPEYASFPNHPVTRGVKPFALVDEWYFNMRWRPESKGVTPILVAKPSDSVRNGPYVSPAGPYPHIQEAKGREETMMWVFERPDGGRGFGFTGGHKHVNWSNENCRKVVLNALLWIAKAEVPPNGVECIVPLEQIAQNLDPKRGASPLNVSGKWNFQVETPNGTGTPSFSFAHAGQNLIGQYSGLLGEAEVTGSVKGQEVKFAFTANRDGQSIPVTYSGTIESATEMKGKVQFGELGEGTWSAKK
jgi:type 1 glutamine amidotransferase